MTKIKTKREIKIYDPISPKRQKKYPGILQKAKESGVLELHVPGEWLTLGFTSEEEQLKWFQTHYPIMTRRSSKLSINER